MGYAGSADIFKAEMMKLMEALEYVQEYIDDLLVITRGTLQDHLITKGGYQEATPNGIVSQYRQIVHMYPQNRIPWWYTH